MMWRNILMTTMVLAIIVVGQCQSNRSPSAVSAPLQPPQTEDIRVAVVPPGFTSPFHVAVKDGALKAAAKLGWTVDVVAAEREGDFAGQITVVEQEIQKGVVAVTVNPIDAKAIVTAVRKANQAGIPVFMHNLITPIDKGTVVEYIGYDQWSGAAKLARYTCDLLGAEGEVFILTGIPGFHTNRRTQGYKWGLQQWCPNVKVVGEQTAEWEREKAVNVATAALQQNPGIDVFYGNSDEMGIGACIAAQKLERQVNQDIWCISIDGNDVTLDLIEKDQTTATLGVYPKMIGRLVIEQMNKVLNGKGVPYILETPSTVVDIKNVTDYKMGKTWADPIEGSPEFDDGLPSGEFNTSSSYRHTFK